MNLCSLPSRASALSLALAAAFPCSSPAQTAALKETVVTATRFAEPAQSLPLGVSVITAEEIRASGATTVNDAIVRLLGVQGRLDLSNGNDTSIDLRGFGVTADANQVVIVDGLRLSEGDSSAPRLAGIPIESVQRIEVLRGSGAVLYGEGATGGVIVITTKAGSGKQRASGGTVYAAGGSDKLRELRASGTVATANGLAFDADVQKRKSDGFRQNSASEQEAGSVTGQWSNSWLRLGARVGRDDLDARLPGSLTPAQFAADPRQAAPAFRNDHGSIRNDRASAFAQADVGNWQLAFDAGRREKEVRSEFSGVRADYDVAAHNYSVRGRHQAKADSFTNILVLGVDRNDWERTNNSFGADTSSDATAFFAKDDVVFGTGTRASMGARTEKIRKEGGGVLLDNRQNAWELGLSHPIATDWTAWFRLGHSYRLPNADEFSFMRADAPLRPQESNDAEAGARWAYGSGRLEARLYRSALKSEIGFDPNAPRTFFGANVNFDPTRREGVELDWNHAITAALGVQANAAVRRATFRSGPYEGKDVPLVSRKALAVRANWVPVADHRFNAGVNWVSSQFVDYQNTCRIPSRITADARYAWQFHRNAEFALGVTNLFDRQFYTQAFGCFGGETLGVYPEPGRQFSASVRVQF